MVCTRYVPVFLSFILLCPLLYGLYHHVNQCSFSGVFLITQRILNYTCVRGGACARPADLPFVLSPLVRSFSRAPMAMCLLACCVPFVHHAHPHVRMPAPRLSSDLRPYHRSRSGLRMKCILRIWPTELIRQILIRLR